MKRLSFGVMLILLVIGMLTLAFKIPRGEASPSTVIVPDDYVTIQAGVNAASPGDTVYVRAGTYYEHVVVNKTLSLLGEGAQDTIIDGGSVGGFFGNVVTITAEGVSLIGFTMRNSGPPHIPPPYLGPSGLLLSDTNSCEIYGNNIVNNWNGVGLFSSFNNSLAGNNITNNSRGLLLQSSSSNEVVGNSIAYNFHGATLDSSSNNLVGGNNFVKDGLDVSSSGNVVIGNLVNERALVYMENASNAEIDGAGQVILFNCTGIRMEGLDASDLNESNGVFLSSSTSCIIFSSNMSNDWSGVEFDSSSGNSVIGNCLTADSESGVGLISSSSNNSVVGNNLTNDNVGIWLQNSYNNSVVTNYMTNNWEGVRLDQSSSNSIIGNNMPNNTAGIDLGYSDNNSIIGNNLTKSGSGIFLFFSDSNNGIFGNSITDNQEGIDLGFSGAHVEGRDYDNSITGNNITDNNRGVYVGSSFNNSIVGNSIMANNESGIYFDSSSNNSVTANDITMNDEGICVSFSSNNSVTGNNIANNQVGVLLNYSSSNIIFHDNFVDNVQQVSAAESTSAWDDGYPSGGNYWSDYNGTDANHDGIGDTPYVINSNNTDHYPLMKQEAVTIPEFLSTLILPLFMIATLLTVIVYRRHRTLARGRAARP